MRESRYFGSTLRLSAYFVTATMLALVTGWSSASAGGIEIASVFGGTVPCEVAESDVRFCEGDVTKRVETWDGIPIDANLTLPPSTFDPPYPLIINLHGWSGSKTGSPSVDFALGGYAVLDYTARGFHTSCGSAASRETDNSLSDPDVCATRGWTHLGDARYEGRDSQYLAGLLVDEGLVIANKVLAMGPSYGGGRSMMLAVLKNRVMLPDGTFAPWTSPSGTPMEMAAAAPLIPWSDLAFSLVPNGWTLDYRVDNPYGLRAGVPKLQWTQVLFATGAGAGFYAPPGMDPEADLISWNTRILAGEPFGGDLFVKHMLEQFTDFRSPYYHVEGVEPAPMLIYNAWTDDLFPASEALRVWRKIKDEHPNADVNLHFADGFGHPRAGLAGNFSRVSARVREFFDFHVFGSGSAVPGVEIYTQECGGSEEAGPFAAADWDALHLGVVTHLDGVPRVIDQSSGDTTIAAGLAPLAGGACRTIAAADDPTAATYNFPATVDGFTLAGSPTISAEMIAIHGEFAQLAVRLWEVSPGGEQSLVAHGFYRPRLDNLDRQAFQLPANGWQFKPGYAPKLEIVGASSPMGATSAGPFKVIIGDLELRLPVLEAGGTRATVRPPAPDFFPSLEADAPACPSLPSDACRAAVAPKGSRLVIKSPKAEGKEKVLWGWKGEATSGPEFRKAVAERGYTLCAYDAEGTLLLSSKAPISSLCEGASCWKSNGPGTKLGFATPVQNRVATKQLLLKAGRDGRALIKFDGRGALLGLAPLPLEGFPLQIQLFADSEDDCWGATFDTAKKANARVVKAFSN